jgi:hypothetical protein
MAQCSRPSEFFRAKAVLSSASASAHLRLPAQIHTKMEVGPGIVGWRRIASRYSASASKFARPLIGQGQPEVDAPRRCSAQCQGAR